MWVFWLGNKIQDFKVKYLGKEIRIPSSKASKGERAVEKLYFIEYDGQQHYRPVKHFGGKRTFFYQRLRDIVEGWECKDRGIPLLRIKYNIPLSNIDSIILNFLHT